MPCVVNLHVSLFSWLSFLVARLRLARTFSRVVWSGHGALQPRSCSQSEEHLAFRSHSFRVCHALPLTQGYGLGKALVEQMVRSLLKRDVGAPPTPERRDQPTACCKNMCMG